MYCLYVLSILYLERLGTATKIIGSYKRYTRQLGTQGGVVDLYRQLTKVI
jgi:hypothetical protein